MPIKTLQIPTPDGLADGFAAFPEHGGQHPGVLLYMDAIGLRPVLEETARELAGHGYYVLVPNLFYRYGPAPVVEVPGFIGQENRVELFGQLMPMVDALTPELALRDAGAYLAFLTSQPEVGAGPVGTVGYCMGGGLAMRTAAAHPELVAAVAGFHPGGLVTDAPDSPHRLAAKLTAEVHFGLAEHDLTPEGIAELGRALDAAGVDYSCEVYPGTLHGFTMADTAAFSPAGMQRHWERLLPLLGRTLGKG
ncbi:dienelactone hydrolase family protein [Streptomyces violascens]|uniref:dienelactone hydrolase family protein n=2 Tax=Streptomyces violascens TaxID=67381 RepID=UPI001676531A|nr:dienelactone hydrolase family protein [Streptomyces violascens]